MFVVRISGSAAGSNAWIFVMRNEDDNNDNSRMRIMLCEKDGVLGEGCDVIIVSSNGWSLCVCCSDLCIVINYVWRRRL